MTAIRKLVVAVLFISTASAPGAAAEEMEDLGFLAGAWGKDGHVVEYWLPPLRGLMVGVNREPAGDGMPFFEYLRIEARADGIFYVASPKGGGTTDFRLTELSGSRAVFENPEHDFPTKIIYSRTGDRLRAEVGAERDGEWGSLVLDWSRVDCDADGAPASEGDETR